MQPKEEQEDEEEEPDEEMMSRDSLLRIFTRFHAVVTTEAGKQRLREAVVAGKVVEDETATIQREICEEFGYNGDYGLRCFRRILKRYKDDAPLIHTFMRFCQVLVCVAVKQEETGQGGLDLKEEGEMGEIAFDRRNEKLV